MKMNGRLFEIQEEKSSGEVDFRSSVFMLWAMQALSTEQPLQGANSDVGDISSSYWAELFGLTVSGLISIFYMK